MRRRTFVVEFIEGEWRVSLSNNRQGVFLTQREAIDAAIRQAGQHDEAEVIVRFGDGIVRTVWPSP